MIKLYQLLTADRVAADLAANSKKRTLEQVAELLHGGSGPVATTDIFNSLLGRERLGSTAIGHGVAIPHGRLPGLQQPIGAFARYPAGLDFDAADQEPVKLVFALLVPAECTSEHLALLAELAETFSRSEVREQLLQAHSADDLYRIFVDQAA